MCFYCNLNRKAFLVSAACELQGCAIRKFKMPTWLYFNFLNLNHFCHHHLFNACIWRLERYFVFPSMRVWGKLIIIIWTLQFHSECFTILHFTHFNSEVIVVKSINYYSFVVPKLVVQRMCQVILHIYPKEGWKLGVCGEDSWGG